MVGIAIDSLVSFLRDLAGTVLYRAVDITDWQAVQDWLELYGVDYVATPIFDPPMGYHVLATQLPPWLKSGVAGCGLTASQAVKVFQDSAEGGRLLMSERWARAAG